MTKHVAIAALLALALTGAARAESGKWVATQDRTVEPANGALPADHPKAQAAPSKDLKVKITFDQVLRSCCAPATLVVSGTVTNVSNHPIDYIRFYLSFEDDDGNIVYAETSYNKKAVSLNDDQMAMKIFNEKPHFETIPPGGSDTFSVSTLMPWVPPFTRLEVVTNPVRGANPNTTALR